MRDMPLSEVDNELTCEGMKYVKMSFKTLRKDIISFSDLVAEEIKKFLPSQFGLMLFDGWTDTHYIGNLPVLLPKMENIMSFYWQSSPCWMNSILMLQSMSNCLRAHYSHMANP